MKRPTALPAQLATLAAVFALGACRPSSESREPNTTTPTAPMASASAGASVGTPAVDPAASGTMSGEQTAPRTDGTGSASPTGTPK